MLHTTPDWALRHHFYHHSNPRSKPRAKTFFEKAHLRPLVDKAWQIARSDQSDEYDREDAFATIKRLTNGRKSAPMQGGIETQGACDAVLLNGTDMTAATESAVKQFQAYEPRDWDGGKDADRKDKYIEELPKVIEHAIAGLREAMARENRVLGEIELLSTLPGIALPHNTRPDYARRGDLKTKWSKPSSRSKSGWQAGSLPSSLSGMFDMNNVYQCAGFWALNGNLPPFLVYANATDYRVFTPDNAPELRDDFLADVVEDIRRHHKTTENLLRAAADKTELLGLVSPDWSELAWQEPPAILEEAKKLWRL